MYRAYKWFLTKLNILAKLYPKKMNEAEDAIDNNTATCSASNPSANKPQLEGREIKDSPYKLIGKCFAAGK